MGGEDTEGGVAIEGLLACEPGKGSKGEAAGGGRYVDIPGQERDTNSFAQISSRMPGKSNSNRDRRSYFMTVSTSAARSSPTISHAKWANFDPKTQLVLNGGSGATKILRTLGLAEAL